MAKVGIHPEMHEVTFTMSDNRAIVFKSAYAKSSKVLLDTDIFIHSAWKAPDERGAIRNTSVVSAFRDMFGGGSLFDSGYKGVDLEAKDSEKDDSSTAEPVASAIKKRSTKK